MSTDLVFDLTPRKVSVVIDGKAYSLQEASGDAACRYRNALLDCTQLGPEGKPTKIKGMADVEPFLLSLCLYDENGKLVPANKIRQWPSRIQKAIFEKLKEISELDEEEGQEDSLKNVPSDTTDGSV